MKAKELNTKYSIPMPDRRVQHPYGPRPGTINYKVWLLEPGDYCVLEEGVTLAKLYQAAQRHGYRIAIRRVGDETRCYNGGRIEGIDSPAE